MNCNSCGIEIPSSFSYTIKKNECPACGSVLIDTETMAFVEELKSFILDTVEIREEIADVLAFSLVVSYNIFEKKQNNIVKKVAKLQKKDIIKSQDEEASLDNEIVKASDLFDPNNPISQTERDEILKERIENRLIQQAMIPSNVATRQVGSGKQLSDSEMAENPILMAQRLQRLQQQEANELSGVSKIRRRE